MTQVNKSGSRIIEHSDGSVLIDSSDALLVDHVSVIAKTDVSEDGTHTVVMELTGRVNRTEERTSVLAMMVADDTHEVIGLLVEAMLNASPGSESKLFAMIGRIVSERNAG